MRFMRWLLGLIFIGGFVIFNFVFYSGPQKGPYFAGISITQLMNMLLFCTLFVLYRVLRGPSSADRIVAVDILGILIIGLLALMGLACNTHFCMDVALIWALLSFIASLAFSKILEGRSLDD